MIKLFVDPIPGNVPSKDGILKTALWSLFIKSVFSSFINFKELVVSNYFGSIYWVNRNYLIWLSSWSFCLHSSSNSSVCWVIMNSYLMVSSSTSSLVLVFVLIGSAYKYLCISILAFPYSFIYPGFSTDYELEYIFSS